MLENISWGKFLQLLGIVLTCYYGIVVIRYFRSEVSGFLLNRKRGETDGNTGVAGMGEMAGITERTGKWGMHGSKQKPSLDNLSALLAEIDMELMANAGTKAELIQLLGRKVGHYRLPDSNASRKIVMNHLLLVAKAAKVDLREGDLLTLFNNLHN
ncbi:hypothetical protein [uncultured Algoriphagus sp.]|uniref:hypothetical protein n=1 Tax=uncultured Algoriphagus sp. TaxID=417365 RepID=UPI0030ED5021|tara:strand:+ start:2580 stop:3047 length:468 start_codon:yes stop_codon:yes gene_type:complete